MGKLLTLLILVTTSAAVAVGCGDDDKPDGGGSAAHPASPANGLQHIHGLGVRRGDLVIATHTGLWIAPAGQTKARRIGSSRQDVMGFSVIDDERFIGSGHPDPTQTDRPPNLGLIESRDGGRTWKSVSLLGAADFHVLRSAGQTVYGFDGTQGRLMVSGDGGRRWEERKPPAAMFDLAIDPRDSRRVVSSTEQGIFASTDGGKRWRPLRTDTAGLLAWPEADALYLIDGQGQVSRSADGGRQWRPGGGIGEQPVAFIAAQDGLYAALPDGTVRRSEDGGANWAVRATP